MSAETPKEIILDWFKSLTISFFEKYNFEWFHIITSKEKPDINLFNLNELLSNSFENNNGILDRDKDWLCTQYFRFVNESDVDADRLFWQYGLSSFSARLISASNFANKIKVVPRTITGKVFTAQLYDDMKWGFQATIKTLGTLLKCKDERIFVFNLVNAEAYIRISAPSADDPNRRERIPLTPSHWQGHYGESYEESRMEVVKTLEGMPEGFVKITLPQMPAKKPAAIQLQPLETEKEIIQDGTI